MDIIFGRENAEQMREKYTVLDLETVTQEGQEIEVFCLIPADKIGITEMPDLENWIKLHHDFLEGYHRREYDYSKQCIEHLRGKFGGEVDTFYDEIIKRIDIIENAEDVPTE
jgi:hypothetical protein